MSLNGKVAIDNAIMQKAVNSNHAFLPNTINSQVTIPNWQRNSQQQNYKALEKAAEELKTKYPTHQLDKVSQPGYGKNGELIYTLTFKRK